jgi:hypothetical protein
VSTALREVSLTEEWGETSGDPALIFTAKGTIGVLR